MYTPAVARHLLLLLTTLLCFTVPGQLAAAPPNPSATTSHITISSQDGSWGRADAPVTIVEFSDLQCPYCERAHDTMKQLQKRYGRRKLRMVFKHFPLPFHKKARPAAEAAYAVLQHRGQRAFWRFIDAAFENLRDDDVPSILKSIGIAPATLQATLEAGEAAKKVSADIALGGRLAVRGTPHFFINGVRLSGAQPLERFVEIINAGLEAAKTLRRKGVKAAHISSQLTARNYKKPEPPKPTEPEPEPERDETVFYIPIGSSPTQGPANALVTLVEFSDFQCSYCARVQATLEKLQAKYRGKIRMVFKHNPLSFHRRAIPAAQLATEAYRRHGHAGFWRAKAKLFENTRTLEDDDLRRIAGELKLDPKRTMRAIANRKHKDSIQNDIDLADESGASGTPHFFINGQRLVGAQPLERFVEVVEAGIAQAKALRKKGIPSHRVYAHLMKNAKRPEPPERLTVAAPQSRMPSKGPRQAPITVQIFSDFECPFCARTVPTLARLEEHYGHRIRFVFRHYPLPFHSRAMAAHIAAHEVFLQQGDAAFWKYHDLLFESEDLTTKTLVQLAVKVATDGDKVRAAIESEKHKTIIEQDIATSSAGGISGTPGFIINKGWHVGGAQPFTSFKRVIEYALKHP
jgi:protein-disulfide isomerase